MSGKGFMKDLRLQPGSVAHTCNPGTLGGQGGQIIMCNKAKTHSTKYKKISPVWWHMPVVPATQGAEVGGS